MSVLNRFERIRIALLRKVVQLRKTLCPEMIVETAELLLKFTKAFLDPKSDGV